MTELQLFNYETNEVRTLKKGEEVWFVAKDVAEVLGLSDVSKSVERLDEDEKLTRTLFVSGQNRKTWLINESGLYSLILTSRKPEAKQFKRWITHEVIPSIRKHGAYMTDAILEDISANPELISKIISDFKAEMERRREAEQLSEQLLIENEVLKIKAEEWDAYHSSEGTITFGTFGIQYLGGLSPQKIRESLQEKGVISRNKVDGAYSVNGDFKRYFKLVPYLKNTKDGEKEYVHYLKIKINSAMEILKLLS